MSVSEPSAIVTPFRASTLDLSLTPDLAGTFAIAAKAGRAFMSTAMLLGESGVGKTRIARHIHQSSPRSNKPFQVIDLSQATPSLFESEFFGHERGSFTGAAQMRKSPFELANGGTVFLDEIGTLSFDLQARLLRIIQDKTFKRVGGSDDIKVDVRILAATSLNLEEKVRKGEFREDLYHRLNVLQIHIPPLRNRPNDIIPLAEHFLEQASIVDRLPRKHLSEDAKAALITHDWPGNVRALENEMSRATIMTDGEVIEPSDLSFRQKVNNTFALNSMRTQTVTSHPVITTPKIADSAFSDAIDKLSRLQTFKEMEEVGDEIKRHLLSAALTATHFVRVDAGRDLGTHYTNVVYQFKKVFDSEGSSDDDLKTKITLWSDKTQPYPHNAIVQDVLNQDLGANKLDAVDRVIDLSKRLKVQTLLAEQNFSKARVARIVGVHDKTISIIIEKNPDLLAWFQENDQLLKASKSNTPAPQPKTLEP